MTTERKAVLVNPLALEVCAKFASTDTARPALGKVNVTPSGGLEASDGHRAIRVRPLGIPDDEYPAVLLEGQHAPNKRGTLIPRDVADKFAKTARKLTAKSAQPILRVVAVSTNAQSASLTATNLDSTAREEFRVGEEQFPDMEQVWPKKEPVFRIAFDADLLAEVLTGLSKLGSGYPQFQVIMEFHGSLSACVLTNSDGSAQALVMPLMMPKDRVTP